MSTVETCYSAGDMADNAAKGFREGFAEGSKQRDELLAALRGMFNEFGELEYDMTSLQIARTAIAHAESGNA